MEGLGECGRSSQIKALGGSGGAGEGLRITNPRVAGGEGEAGGGKRDIGCRHTHTHTHTHTHPSPPNLAVSGGYPAAHSPIAPELCMLRDDVAYGLSQNFHAGANSIGAVPGLFLLLVHPPALCPLNFQPQLPGRNNFRQVLLWAFHHQDEQAQVPDD